MEQPVGGLGGSDLDLEAPVPVAKPEGDALQARWQLRGEPERAAHRAHAAEAGDEGRPRPGQRRQVQPVAGVVLEVVEIHARRLTEVVVGELQVPDLGGHHRLGGG